MLDAALCTYLKEATELGVMLNLVLQTLLSQRQVAEVSGVREPELCRGLQENVPDTLDDRCLLSLSDEHDLQQAAVTFSQIQDIVEDLVDKFVNLAGADDRRPCCTKWTNEELNGNLQHLKTMVYRGTYTFYGVEVPQVLLLSADDLVDDARQTSAIFASNQSLYIRTFGG